MIHVYPINDLKEHDMCSTCDCCPKTDVSGDEIICIHNSYDGREGVELANEVLSGIDRDKDKANPDDRVSYVNNSGNTISGIVISVNHNPTQYFIMCDNGDYVYVDE